ncbi:fibronectin type III domain-containing protein, partial [bacterium]|nr:fibronectin type III domain-containing protein [bacterium]
GGELIIQGDYNIGTTASAPSAILNMTNANDYVCVNGNFFTNSGSVSQLTNGTLEIKGNFTQISSAATNTGKANFSAGGNHTTIFSGATEQVISFAYPLNSGFGILQNENSLIDCSAKMRAFFIDGTNPVFDTLYLCGTCTALADINISSFELDGGSFDLNGHTIYADDITATSSSTLFIDGGQLLVSGDAEITYSILKMNNKDDYVCVDGDFTFSTDYSYGYDTCLTNGLLELKGDFVLDDYSEFIATENHKTLFNGTSTQTIYGNYYFAPDFNRVEFRNSNIVCDTGIGVNVMEKCNAYFDSISISGKCKLMDDFSVGDLSVSGMDLNGYTVTVNGDCSCNRGMLNINKGKLLIDGDLNVFSDEDGYLIMENPEDYICVNGDFSIDSIDPIENNLTDGVLEIKGDFNQLSLYDLAAKSFVPSQNHKTVLSGTGVQNVTFEDYPDSKFNTLILTKEQSTGYTFTPSVVWTTLINAYGAETPSAPTNLNLVSKTSKTVKITWTIPSEGSVLGYKI